jgi:mycofactocin precursor
METDNKTERMMIENEAEDIYKIEEIKIEEMTIDGICGVY